MTTRLQFFCFHMHFTGLHFCLRTGGLARAWSCVPIFFGILFLCGVSPTGLQADDSKPDGTQAATAAMAAFRLPEGFRVELFAAEPMLTNPIAFCLDEQGRVFVAEDHRFLEGTPENRSHNFLLDDDLQVKTLDDRVAMQKKWADRFEGGSAWFTQKSDIIRQLVDSDGDGRADISTVFADGFDGPLDGLGSGLIARDGKVWYTCIPSLWQLSDNDNDGRADSRTALLEGFGVNAAFYGHDLHGLVWGVDGRLYFSVGDRGAHVVTKEGVTISNPRRGAVYRCNPDGTEMERIHQGLRNPQELAVDQYGNLFADDNNCDKGDDSRLVYIVPGGDSGWNMAYQHIPEPYLTGPWHAEAIWHLSHELQPAYVVPPVGKIGAGPSGFVFSSGTSLPARYRNHFFYCNFTGNGGVESFALQPEGAGFTIVDHHDFCKPIMASDVDFGYDGKMYLSDYPTNPFDRTTSGGRIYTVFDPTRVDDPIVVETRRLFQQGFEHRGANELVTLLHHDDMRVRLRAQFAMAARGIESAGNLTAIANTDSSQLARLHAIWGLGQIGRSHPEVLSPVILLLSDGDSEVRAQAARVLGESRHLAFGDALIPLLADESQRVRFFAAIALGSLRHRSAAEHIITMLRDNDGRDRQLAHAGVAALELIGDSDLVQKYASDTSMAVRMAVLLVQRRLADDRIIQFLDDAELKIVTEAARAINDLPMTAGREKLASLAERYQNASGDEVVPLLRRIVNANLQLGGRSNAEAVIAVAISESLPLVARREAIAALAAWQGSTTRDRVTGFWQPIESRDGTVVREAVQQAAARLLSVSPDELHADITGLLVTLKVETDDRLFAEWAIDANRTSSVRIAALRLLNSRKFKGLPAIIDTLLATNSAELRAEARDLLADHNPDRANSLVTQLLEDQDADVREKQRAFATLARIKSPEAGKILDQWAVRLRQRQVPIPLQLDLIDALTAATSASRQAALSEFRAGGDAADPLNAWQVALEGGNAERGRSLVVSHAVAQCIRCHTVDARGGTAGPDLSAVASKERNVGRRYLLESMILPSAKIAKGFGTVTLVLDSGKLVAGTVKDEDAESLTLVTPQNETIRIARDTIDEQSATTSAMPTMTRALTLREIRDLVEYLSTLTKKSAP